MTVRREPLSQARENRVCIRVADMMEETVDKNEIELSSVAFIRCHVGCDEGPVMFSPSAVNVSWIDVDAEIVGVCEVLCICAWATTYVEHAPHFAEIVMLQHRCYLLRCKRSLPETVNHRLFKEKIY